LYQSVKALFPLKFVATPPTLVSVTFESITIELSEHPKDPLDEFKARVQSFEFVLHPPPRPEELVIPLFVENLNH
jgi:hypothetical protein